MEHQDLYIMTTCPGDWANQVSHHRVWDATLFVERLRDEGFEVKVITEAEYISIKRELEEDAA